MISTTRCSDMKGHKMTPARALLEDFLADKSSDFITAVYTTPGERSSIETTARQLRSYGHAIDTITVDKATHEIKITKRKLPRLKMIMFQGHPYTVLDETTTEYVCQPLHNNEGYSYISKDKATVLDTDEARKDE